MKKILVTALSCLFVTISVAGCSDDVTALLPGIHVASPGAGYSGQDVADSVETACGDFCDGDLNNEGLIAAESDNDDYALFYLVFLWGQDWLWDTDITDSDEYADAIAELTEATELTFNISRTTYCNSTGTEGSAAGDATGGAMIESLVWTTTHDSKGTVGETDREYTWVLTFANCLIEGNLLSQAAPMGVTLTDESAVRLNGSYVWRETYKATPSPSDPSHYEVLGTVSLSTDGDGDGTFGSEFWTRVVNINANVWDDGDGWDENGGACAGEAIDFGEDDTIDTDDTCAEDTDMVNDAFFRATGWFWE